MVPQQRAPIGGRFRALRRAVEETHAKCVLEVGNRLRHHRVRDGQAIGRARHAAGLHHRQKDMQVAQLEPAADAVAPLYGHGGASL
jgi:hypothetical protein